MKIILPFITLCFLFALLSCSENEKSENNTIKKPDELFIKDNVLYKNSNDTIPFTGRYVGTADGRRIEYEVVDGKKEGEFILYYLNGNIELQGSLKANKNIGHWKYYYETGELESEGNFVDDKPEGEWIWYYKNGNIKEEGFFNQAKREGEWHFYKLNGELDFKRDYEEGLEVDLVEPEDVKE